VVGDGVGWVGWVLGTHSEDRVGDLNVCRQQQRFQVKDICTLRSQK
jgi:hypothetical protein